MAKAYLSSFTVDIYIARRRQTSIINIENKKFGENGTQKDILDILHNRLSDPNTFNIYKPVQKEDGSVGPNLKKICLHSQPKSGIVERNGINAYKYVYFSINYGVCGESFYIDKSTGEQIGVSHEDHPMKTYYIFLAYPCDDEATSGVLFIQSIDSNSAQTEISRLLKESLKEVDEEKFTVNVVPFATRDAVKEYIRSGRVEDIILTQRSPAIERGGATRYGYKKLILGKPRVGRVQGLVDVLMGVFDRTHNPRQATGIPEIDNFEPDTIQFVVKTDEGQKTYSTASPNTGIIKMLLPDHVLRADGVIIADQLLEEMKSIYEAEHTE